MFLGINLATSPQGIGFFDKNKGYLDYTNNFGYGFSENLVLEVEKFAVNNGFSLQEIKGIGVTVGPGSYTGLRVGVTFAKTFGQIKNLPIYAFSTLEAFVFSYIWSPGLYISMIPACQGEVNVGIYAVNYKREIKTVAFDFSVQIEIFKKHLEKIEGKVKVVGIVPQEILSLINNKMNIFINDLGIIYGSNIAKRANVLFEDNIKGEYKNIFPKYSHVPNLGKKKKLDTM